MSISDTEFGQIFIMFIDLMAELSQVVRFLAEATGVGVVIGVYLEYWFWPDSLCSLISALSMQLF